jgi:glycosyltransferase involved in cell wall biosynthesis
VRILLVNNFFWPRTTGSSHFSEGIAERYVAEGHEVLVVTTAYGDFPADEVHLGYRIVRLPSFSLSPGRIAFNYALPFAARPSNLRRMRRIFDDFRPDVVHQNGQFFDLTFISTWFAARRAIPRIITVHTALTHDRSFAARVIRLGDRLVVKPLNRWGRPMWVVIDKRIDAYVREVYRPDEDDIAFLPAAIEPDRFVGGDGASVRERHGLGDSPVVMSFGHVIPLRDRVSLVRALPIVRRSLPDVKVLVVGHVYTDDFLALARELGVDDCLVVVGRVEHDEVRDYAAAADCEGHDLSGWGLGITTMEVMAAGVPVFAVLPHDNYPGVDLDRWPDLELLADDEPETVAASVLRLIGDRGRRAAVVAEQHRFVDDLFTMQAVGKRYLELIARRVSAG